MQRKTIFTCAKNFPNPCYTPGAHPPNVPFWPIGVIKCRWLTQYTSDFRFFWTRCNATSHVFTRAKKIGYRPYVGSLVAVFGVRLRSRALRSGGSWSLLGRRASLLLGCMLQYDVYAVCDGGVMRYNTAGARATSRWAEAEASLSARP